MSGPSSARSSKLATLFDLSGRVAIVTGGSRGLGMQIAAALGEFGARPVLVARKPLELESAVAALAAEGVAAESIVADIGTPGAAELLTAEVMRRHRRIDILVNCAGTTWGAAAESYPSEAWDKVLQLNVTGLFSLIQAAARAAFLPMKSGAILNVASVEGLGGHHPQMLGTVAYNASKGAVVNLTRALAAEWGPYGIRVNALAPGYFPSKMTGHTLEEHGAYLRSQTPLGRLGGPDDLKGAALLLVSDAGRHMTGQTLIVDGGASVI